MKTYNIKDMKNGWFIGNFEPSIFKNPFFEVAHHHHTPGQGGPKHYHKIAQELNYVLAGKVVVNGKTLVSGDFFLYEPEEISDIQFLEATDLIVIKWPSVPSDKYLV